MRTYLPIVFSLFLVSAVLISSTVESSFAEEVIATSIGFEDSTILELKNSRGNLENISSIRIWISEGNEFKSFKTEQGWIGKKQLNGVIEFTSQNEVKPGEGVKFGLKTIVQNPIINWKALDSNGEVISSASTKAVSSEKQPILNNPVNIGVKEESSFRFIPEKPNSDSNFRVIGKNFVPNQTLDFYIDNKLVKSVESDSNGNILFTSKTPKIKDDTRTEFILRDSGGTEKSISIRILQVENRDIPDLIKLSLGNTPQQVKRGESIMLQGMATPNTTLTITSKHENGDIININTIQSGFDGKWSYNKLFSPELDLGVVSVSIDDGKTTALRNIDVISAKIINIFSEEIKYEAGDTITFEGIGIPDEDMSVIIEDPIGAEIFSRSVSVNESGSLKFNVEIPRGSMEGTYLLLAFQGNEESVSIFGIGQEPEPVLILRPTQLNYSVGEVVEISIQGPPNAQVALIVIDASDREKLSDTMNLGPSGREIFSIDSTDLPTGAYTIDARRGESTGSAIFAVGLSKGSGAISVQTTKEEYRPGEQVLILGNTGAINVLLDIEIRDTSGKIIKKIETFSDKFGVFKIDNFRIPSDGIIGEWKMSVKSGGNFSESVFQVGGEDTGITIQIEKSDYSKGEIIIIAGDGARKSATVSIYIYDSDGTSVDTGELNITATGTGVYQTQWIIPMGIESGEYKITVDDGSSDSSFTFKVN
tara:strand:+ start:123 stop:2240 length:2118 start_codon:yes stop_codon:yes gene_type:complete